MNGRQIEEVPNRSAELDAEIDKLQEVLNELVRFYMYSDGFSLVRSDAESAVHKAISMLNGTKWEIG